MSLTNQQYDQIIKEYSNKRALMDAEIMRRREYVSEHVDGFKELDEAIGSFALSQTRSKLFGGDVKDTESVIDELTASKKALLVGAGFPEDYLEPYYECDDCKDTGYINGVKCHCFKKSVATLLYEQSNLGAILDKDNFSKLSYDYYQGEDLEHFKKAVSDCHRFVDEFDNQYRNMLFYGNVGTGKSFLSGCIAKELLDKDHSVVYYSSPELFKVLSDIMFDKGNKQMLNSLRDIIYSADLLIIDDLGTELFNSATASQLFSILTDRNLNQRATIISTNLELSQLNERYDDRIFSRLLQMYTFEKISGPDIRRIKRIKNY